jgi:integrase
MESFELAHSEERHLTHQQIAGRSRKTTQHCRDTFKHFASLCAATKHLHTPDSLTKDTIGQLIVWRRDTPTRPWRGSIERSPLANNGNLKDLRACLYWLREELVTRMIKVPFPRLPRTLLPILTAEEIQQVWPSQHLTFPGDLGKRNAALMALILDTGHSAI